MILAGLYAAVLPILHRYAAGVRSPSLESLLIYDRSDIRSETASLGISEVLRVPGAKVRHSEDLKQSLEELL
jgi:hypothetical protein